MLISFEAENWKSFPSLEFSAIAGKEQRHAEHIARVEHPRLRLLPISAFFGVNASGKSNLFEAMDFARRYVVDGVKPSQWIGVKPFALDLESSKRPTSFEFVILADERVFRYSFTATRAEVFTESLFEIRQTVEKEYFTRQGEEIRIGDAFKDESLEVVGRGTQKNLLFLTNSVNQKRAEFRAVFDWFQDRLLLLSPTASCNPFETYVNRRPFQPQNQESLRDFDLGIERIDAVEIPWNQIPFNVDADNAPDVFQIGPYLFTRENDERKAYKLVAVHNVEDKKILFELADESDGTRRLLDLIPAFNLLRDDRVVFIDEIDRSLHHLLTRKLIEDYLAGCNSAARSQLFFTTHDALLLDQDLLRRDEMWLVDKRDDRSSLLSLNDFRIRHDKSLLKSYLYGRFGGAPNL